MTYREILFQAEKKLQDAGIYEAKNDAWLLFEYAFNMARHEYIMKMNDIVTDKNRTDTYAAYIDKRITHVPVQHITGSQEFMGLKFFVSDAVLIPRQDTEILVERALRIIKKNQGAAGDKINNVPGADTDEANQEKTDRAFGGYQVLDMCTGSGCIAISIQKLSGVSVTAVDISEEALGIAKRNAEYNGVTDIKFINSNLFEKINENSDCDIHGKYDMIVSNPPYIPSRDIEELMPEVRDYEPRLALDGTEDGLEFYRRITKESPKYIKSGGWLLYEIGSDQGEAVKNLMEESGYTDVAILKDLAGLDRVVIGTAGVS